MAVVLFLLLQAVIALLSLDEAAAGCRESEIECRTGGKCVSMGQVCRSGQQCQDGSDEDPQICEFWKYDKNYCHGEVFNCKGSCRYIHDICSRSECNDVLDPRMCKLATSRKLSLEPETMKLTPETLNQMKMAVNTTLHKQYPECPMLYTRVGDLCLAFFSPAKVPWAEARQFCHAIYGELLSFNNLSTFAQILDYLRETLLTSDYWIGGRYDLDTNAWSWVVDDSTMPLGSPYWAVRYNSSACVPRSPPHTDPFSGPSEALPGAPCYNYLQAPTQRSPGWCSALTYENFFYISNEKCQSARSPLCVIKSHPTQIKTPYFNMAIQLPPVSESPSTHSP